MLVAPYPSARSAFLYDNSNICISTWKLYIQFGIYISAVLHMKKEQAEVQYQEGLVWP